MLGPGDVRLPLTAAQFGLWFAQKLDPTNPIFQVASCTEIRGPIDPDLLARAVREMMLEADTLRTRFVETDEGPAQVVCAEPQRAQSFGDLSAEDDPAGAAFAWMERDQSRALDSDADSLGAYRLFQVAEDHYLWYRRAHHLLNDGYGSVVTARRVAELYTARARGEARARVFGPLRSLVEDDLAYHSSDAHRADRAFWLAYMADRTEPATLAGARGTTPWQPRRHSGVLGTAAVASLDRAAGQAGVSWPRFVIAVMVAYLHRMTGAREVTLGLPVAARTTPLTRRVPGMLSNVVPLRCAVTPDLSLRECAALAARELAHVHPHQRFRMERLRGELGLAPDERLYGPWINVMPFYEDLDFAGSRGQTQSLSRGPFQDMSIAVVRHRGGRTVRVDIDADPSLYTAEDLIAHHARIASLLAAADRQLDTPIGALDTGALDTGALDTVTLDTAALDIVTPGPSVSVDWKRVSDLSESDVDGLLQQILGQQEPGGA